MRGPPPIPTRLKVLRGNPGHAKLNQPEPQPDRGEACPETFPWLDVYAQEEWNRTAPGLWHLGLLTIADIGPFASYCVSFSIWRRAIEQLAVDARQNPGTRGGLLVESQDGGPRISPLVKIATTAAAEMIKAATQFGMAPAARARIAAAGWEPPPEPSKFDGLIAG